MMKLSRLILALILAGAAWWGSVCLAQEPKSGSPPPEEASVTRTIGLGAAAAFAIALSVVGAGHAVGRIGSAALGAAAERPELLPRSLLFVALAEGLAVLGFAIAMMLVQKI